MKYISILLILVMAILFSSCNSCSPKKSGSEESVKPKASIPVPTFNSDSAYQLVAEQVAFGPRVPNTKAHDKCAAFLIDKLKGGCKDVMIQKGTVKAWNGAILNFSNIIASWKPGINNRIFLCAHWDSRPYADHDTDPKNHRKPVDAANDGASGVGILLEVARQLSLSTPPIGVDIILFDVEDYGPPEDERNNLGNTEEFWGQGAQYWAKNPHVPDYYAKYGILLDMVGARNATFLAEGFSMYYAPNIVKRVWETAGRIGYSNYFIYDNGPQITDDHVPINRLKGIPTIDLIHLDKGSPTGFYPYWHTTKDNMASIDKATLQAVGQTLLTVIYEDQ